MSSSHSDQHATVTGLKTAPQILVGADTGGTFTDVVLIAAGQVRVHKLLSTPEAPELAIVNAMRELGLATTELSLVHGSTVGTNAVLEGKGVRCAFVTNTGFADLLTLGRQERPRLYDLGSQHGSPPVPAELCLELAGRIDCHGLEIEALTAAEIQRLVAQIHSLKPDSVAVCMLFSYLNDCHERALQQALSGHPFVTCSASVLPEMGEYERAVATWLNAYVGPLMQNYLQRMAAALPRARLSIMQSCATTVAAKSAGAQAVRLLLSGPAGGLAAARYLGEICDQPRLMSFDMGGTSTDVALLEGRIPMTSEGRLAGYPLSVPMVDMHTIGAGGGSLATVDSGGMLAVGPQSAGASPGPACYGAGGGATVTDANVVLGRLPSAVRLGGSLALDAKASMRVIAELGQRLQLPAMTVARGVIDLANAHMAQALRVISVERGHDPADYALCCFGGAGGMHVCALAEALGMDHALAPIHAGVLSALGMLCVAPGRELSQSLAHAAGDLQWRSLEQVFSSLEQRGMQSLREEGVDLSTLSVQRRIDLRYRGQSACITLDWAAERQLEQSFHQAHLQRFGHRLELPVERVTARLALAGPQPRPPLTRLTGRRQRQAIASTTLGEQGASAPVWRREDLYAGQRIDGPAVVFDKVGTTCIDAGWWGQCDDWGNLRLRRSSAAALG